MSWLRLSSRLTLAVLIGETAILAQEAVCPPTGPWWARHPRHQPPVIMPAPLGSYVNAWETAQRFRAEEDDFVIYLNEWHLGAQLGPYGQYHLHQIARRLPGVPFPVKIQPSPDETINTERRALVITLLSQAGVPNAESRVVVALPHAEGLRGDLIWRAYLSQMRTTTGGIGGAGTGGLGLGGGFR